MAGTSTNKQPLLIDRPLMRIVRLDATSQPAGSADPGSGTNGVLCVDCTGNDGALIEDLWLIQRLANDVTPIRLFLSTSAVALGVGISGSQAEAHFLLEARFPATTELGTWLHLDLPRLLAPVPHAPGVTPLATAPTEDRPPQFGGLRIEKGFITKEDIDGKKAEGDTPGEVIVP
jgi:hypothetical protein